MNQLCRLLYLSTGSDKLSKEELEALLSKSRENNLKKNITGALFAGGDLFIQVLEGEDIELIRLYSVIFDDPRHNNCMLVGVSPIAHRIFKDWSMGYLESSVSYMKASRDQLINLSEMHGNADSLIRILNQFVKLLKGN